MKKEKDPILVIAATNRPGALTQAVAEYYRDSLVQAGVPATLLSLNTLAPDFIATALYANKGKDPAFNQLADQVKHAQKMVFIVPQYNGSFPGILKTFIDGLQVKQVFPGKKGALVGVSKGYQGNILGLSHLSDILTYLGMNIYHKKPYLSGIQTPTMEALREHPSYIERLQAHIEGVSNF